MALPLQSPPHGLTSTPDLTLSVAETIAALKQGGGVPAETLRHAAAYAQEIAPTVIALTRKAASGAYLLPWEANLHFWGVHALAAARRMELCGPLLHLFHEVRDEDDLDRLFGDAYTETLTKIVISVFDGNPDPLIAVCAQREADGFVRVQLMRALAWLTFDGAIPTATTFALFERFERETLADPGDPAWEGWQEAIWLLGAAAFFPRIRATWEDGRNPKPAFPMRNWEEEFAKADAGTATLARFEEEGAVPFDDLNEEFGWTTDDSEESDSREPDPAVLTALKPYEIAWLAGFLGSPKVPAHAMSFEQVDGFFCALLAGPVGAQLDEYLPTIWAVPGESQVEPTYDTQEQADYVDALLRRHWNTIRERLDRGYLHEPILDGRYGDATARDWASGFVLGVKSRLNEWELRTHESTIGHFVAAVAMISADPGELKKNRRVTPDQRDAFVEVLPKWLVSVHNAWRGRHDPFPARAGVRKVGRNERCPCGSGKKFKHCCGTPEKLATH